MRGAVIKRRPKLIKVECRCGKVEEIERVRECKKCGECLYAYACPAFYREKGEFRIDEHICLGCSMCSQICPAGAIHPVVKPKGAKS